MDVDEVEAEVLTPDEVVEGVHGPIDISCRPGGSFLTEVRRTN
jgi:hypothetical protein